MAWVYSEELADSGWRKLERRATLGSSKVRVGFTRGRQVCAYQSCGFYAPGVVRRGASPVRAVLRSDFSIWKGAPTSGIAGALWGRNTLALNIS